MLWTKDSHLRRKWYADTTGFFERLACSNVVSHAGLGFQARSSIECEDLYQL
jgi:hypothetical protein